MIAIQREPAYLRLVPDSNTKKRARMYLRVSTEAQEKKYGLSRQETSCTELIEEHAFAFNAITDIYRDTYTGTKLEERNELQRILRDARNREFDVLVMDEYSRLSRRLHHQGAIITELERCGVEVVSVKEGSANGTSAQAVILRAVMGGIAEWERETFLIRSTEGNLERAKSGKPTRRCKAPFGWEWNDPGKSKKEWYVLNEWESAIAVEVFTVCASMKFGCKATANELTRRKLHTPGQLPNETPRAWSPSTVRSIIKNPMYMGKVYQNRTEQIASPRTGKRSNRLRPQDEWLELKREDGQPVAPAIVTEALWHAANSVLANNKRTATRNNPCPQDSLLRAGHIFCAVCGCAYHVNNRANTSTHARYGHDPEAAKRHGCKQTTLLMQPVDDLIWRLVEMTILKPEIIQERLNQQQRENPYEQSLRMFEQRFAKLKVEQKRHTDALVFVSDNPVAAEPIALRLKSLVQELEAVEEERKLMLVDQARWSTDQARVQSLTTVLRRAKRRLNSISYDDQRAFLRVLGVRVLVWPRETMKRGGENWQVELRLRPEDIELVCLTADEARAKVTGSDYCISEQYLQPDGSELPVLAWTVAELREVFALA